MSSTYNGNGASFTPGAAFSITEPSDGDAANVASVNTALSKIADATEWIRLAFASATLTINGVWTLAALALATITTTRSSATVGAGQSVALGTIYSDSTIRGWGYYTVSGGVITLVRGVNQATPSYSGVGAYVLGLQTSNTNYAVGAVMPYHSSPIVVVASSAPGANSLAVKFYNMSSTLTDPLGFLVIFTGG